MNRPKTHQSKSRTKASTSDTVPPRMRGELRGPKESDQANDEPNIVAQPFQSRPFSAGRKIESHLPNDDETTEQMVEEGVDEAANDELATARKTQTKSQG